MTSRLRQFLESEYDEAGVSPAFIRLQGKIYLIPYPYVRDYDDFQKAFMNDFFDVMRQDYNKYKKNKLEPRWIHWSDGEEHRRLVVPYDSRNKEINEEDVAQRIFWRAEKKYRRAVRLAATLAKIFPQRPYQTIINAAQVHVMQKAYYEYQLKQSRDKAAYITKKVGMYLSRNATKVTNNLQNLTLDNLKIKARKWAVRTMLTATVAAAVYTAVNIAGSKDQAKENIEQKARDPYGNLKMFEESRNDIKVSLAFVENFASQPFKDGMGVQTIGYGCTYYIDENGKGNREISPVKPGDKISMADALVQKDRYLDYRILPQIEKLVKVPLDKETMVATVNFAYVVGPRAFEKSQYLNALNDGEKGASLAKYLTGFRQQSGLLSRFYFMGELLKKNISTKDFLELTAEGCYNLNLKDVCVFKGGKLALDKENFASFRDDCLIQNLRKASRRRRSVVNGNNFCPKVRDILPDEIIRATEKKNVSSYHVGLCQER